MRKIKMFIWSVTVLFLMIPVLSAGAGKSSPGETITVWTSPDLYPLGSSLVQAYVEVNDQQLFCRILDENADLHNIPGGNELVLLSMDYQNRSQLRAAITSTIGRKVVVAVMSKDSPLANRVLGTGIAPSELKELLSGAVKLERENGNEAKYELRLHPVVPMEGEAASYLAGFTGISVGDFNVSYKNDGSEILRSLKNDPKALGFCTLGEYENYIKAGNDNVVLVPIDANENGVADHSEMIYGSADELNRGIWIGKYPSALYSRIMIMHPESGLSEGPALSFVTWLLDGGQVLLAENNFSPLTHTEKTGVLAALTIGPAEDVPDIVEPYKARTALILLILIGIVGIITAFVLWIFNSRETVAGNPVRQGPSPVMINNEDVPGGYLLHPSHTWLYVERDGSVRLGIDQFIPRITGQVTRVMMKMPGEKIKKGETAFTLVQQGKRISIKAPASGKIVENNDTLEGDASLINSSPFIQGWIYRIEPSNWHEDMKKLMNSSGYVEWAKSELARLKDFFSNLTMLTGRTQVVLQDGGELASGIMKGLGPEVWEEFQTGFLDNEKNI